MSYNTAVKNEAQKHIIQSITDLQERFISLTQDTKLQGAC